MNEIQSILWRRLDRAGHECATLVMDAGHWRLAGSAVIEHDQMPCLLNYLILCHPDWRTESARIEGYVGDSPVAIDIRVETDNRWFLNGAECARVAGCTDIDLNFSPSTNLLPVRRLELKVGEQSDVRAAWLRFPSFALEPLEQIYRRLSNEVFRYESGGGRFVAELETNRAGFVTRYPGFCETVASIE